MRKFVSILLFICFSVFLYPSDSNAAGNEVERLGGKDRFEVAVEVSQKGWTSSQTVYLVNYLAFADALAATPLAYQSNAPILLTHADHLNQKSKDEIKRLGASKIVLVGGTGSISNKVVSELNQLSKITVIKRIGGKDRYEVSANIANSMQKADKVVIATGGTFADALSVAPYAARNKFPILLTRPQSLPKPTNEFLTRNNYAAAIIVGGEASVSNAVKNKLRNPIRIGGKNRYEVTANLINTFNLPTEKAYLATGLTFADALTGSVLAAKENQSIILTLPQKLPKETMSLIENKDIKNFVILGGPSSVEEELLNKYADTLIVDNQHSIEGYATKPSYNPGETIDFKIHTLSPTFSMEVIRFGDTDEILYTMSGIKGMKQNYRKYDFRQGADWQTTFSLPVPSHWKSGLYGAHIYDASGDFYVMFVIKNSNTVKPKIAVLANTYTWEAYNSWGGGSFYRYYINDGRNKYNSELVSLDRPNPGTNPYEDRTHLTFAEIHLLRWLERNGYNYDMISANDLNEQPSILKNYETIVLNSHSEYWTKSMYDGFEDFIRQGGNVLNLSGNSLYWKIIKKDDQLEVRKDYKYHTLSNERGGLWRDLSRPESSWIGVAYNKLGYATYMPYKVQNANHWIFRNTGLSNGDTFGASGVNGRGASGGETDKVTRYSPKNLVRLAKGTNPNNGGADMIYYYTQYGGGVFSVGSLTFTGAINTDTKVSQILKNVLNHYQVH